MMNLREEAKKELLMRIHEENDVKSLFEGPEASKRVNECYQSEEDFVAECDMFINQSDRLVLLEQGINVDTLIRDAFRKASPINSTIAELIDSFFTALVDAAIDTAYPMTQV